MEIRATSWVRTFLLFKLETVSWNDSYENILKFEVPDSRFKNKREISEGSH